jgi:hypothetical protein
MRKIILIGGIAVGALSLIVAAVLVYALTNLNSIIASRQKLLLDKLSDAAGRSVEIQEIKASLGWGVSVAISGLKIADDPAFSQLPFVAANQVSGAVELLPLLGGEVKVTRLVFDHPEIRVLRDAQGQLNVSTIGKGKQKPAPAAPQANVAEENKSGGALNALSIENFSIEGGNVYYSDAQAGGAAIEIKRVDFDVNDFSAASRFAIRLKLAALGDQQNLTVEGKAGPILSGGAIDPGKIPLDLKIDLGPMLLDKLRGAPQIGSRIPAKLSMPDPVSIAATVKGSLDALAFDFASDLSTARVVYIGLFNKPAATVLEVAGNGSRKGGELAIAKAHLRLADLDLKATKIELGTPIAAQVDTNRFDLATLGPMVAAMAKYDASGRAEIHAAAQLEAGKPSIDGAVTLAGVALKPEGTKLPGITDLSGKISMVQNSAVVEPTNFMIGSGHANLEARAESINPLRATYSVKADSLKVAEFVADRPPGAGEAINQLTVTGSADGEIESPSINAKITSANGKLSSVTYQNLEMNASYAGKTAAVKSLEVRTLGGTVAGNADAVLGEATQFKAAITTDKIDLRQALAAQESSAAKVVRGLLTSQITISGRGNTFDQMKPTFAGNGKIAVVDGKLVGVNVVADALNKIDGLPQIGSLVSSNLIARHPELFNNPDTDLKTLGLTFQLSGPRFTSPDIVAATEDYRILGAGWFDMDKRIDLNLKLLMSKAISNEIIAEKKNVVYVTNQDGEIDIPVLIRGALPKPSVAPDVGSLVQRAASHAIEREGSKAINKFLEKKGLGGLLGGGSGSSGGAAPASGGSGRTPAPSNPLAPFKNLFR